MCDNIELVEPWLDMWEGKCAEQTKLRLRKPDLTNRDSTSRWCSLPSWKYQWTFYCHFSCIFLVYLTMPSIGKILSSWTERWLMKNKLKKKMFILRHHLNMSLKEPRKITKYLSQYNRSAYRSTTMLAPISYIGTMKQKGLFCENKQYDLQKVALHTCY
jgi:hypothetical protein